MKFTPTPKPPRRIRADGRTNTEAERYIEDSIAALHRPMSLDEAIEVLCRPNRDR